MSDTVSPEDLQAQRLGYADAAHQVQEDAMMRDKDPAHWNEQGQHVSQMNRAERRDLARAQALPGDRARKQKGR